MFFEKAVATVLGIGYIKKGAGTVASVVYCIAWYFLSSNSIIWNGVFLILTLIAGYWSAGAVEKYWGRDSNKVVIDEVAGMMIALLSIPINISYAIPAFLLFRFFDIVKPVGIKKLENLPSGWGVMADDVLAGLYALLILKTVIAFNVM